MSLDDAKATVEYVISYEIKKIGYATIPTKDWKDSDISLIVKSKDRGKMLTVKTVNSVMPHRTILVGATPSIVRSLAEQLYWKKDDWNRLIEEIERGARAPTTALSIFAPSSSGSFDPLA